MLNYNSFQQREGLCGPASLKIVLSSFGINKSEKELAKKMKCTKAGVEAEEILKIAKKLGLKGYIKEKATIEDIKKELKNNHKRIIVDWFLEDDGHFSVVSSMDKENIYLQDPDIGCIRAIRLDIFNRIWFDFPGKYMKTKKDLLLRRMLILQK
ncbi:MAG: cysteine peptidase family C39 domain-containing protein [Candidatus Nanoarchaeia archaeon]